MAPHKRKLTIKTPQNANMTNLVVSMRQKQENNKEQNRNILASLAKTSDERKANARRINAKQRTESRRRSKCVRH